MTVSWKYDDLSTISPILKGGHQLIEFMKAVFDAKVQVIYPMGEDGVGHAELKVGESSVMTRDPFENDVLSAASVSIYVPDCDATHAKALEHGGKTKDAPKDQFWGDRNCQIIDPCGNTWSIATRIEELTQAEIRERLQSMG